MKLAFSNIGFENDHELIIFDLLLKNGFTGLEIAPPKFVGENPYSKIDEAKQKAKEIKQKYGLNIPSMQSIWFGQTGNIFVPGEAKILCDYTKKAVVFAKEINCKSMVFGCPKNRNMPNDNMQSSAIGFFEEIADFARKNNTAIALEANVREYGTNFINTSKQAFDFAKSVANLKVNYDLGTLIATNETLKTLEDNLNLVSHIHISEPCLAPIEKREVHKQLARLLKANNYQNYVSIEMKSQSVETVKEIVEYIAEVFS